MFAVKRTGGSTYAFFEPHMELDASDQLALQTDLRQAIEQGALELYYQPKVDARTREFTGVEALVRWQHAVRGAVGPTELIAVAERFGLIGQIGQWVFDEACRQMRAWRMPACASVWQSTCRRTSCVRTTWCSASAAPWPSTASTPRY